MGPVRQSTDIHLHLEGEYPQTRADDEQIERMSQVNFSSLQFLQSLHSENFKTELRFIQKEEVAIQQCLAGQRQVYQKRVSRKTVFQNRLPCRSALQTALESRLTGNSPYTYSVVALK